MMIENAFRIHYRYNRFEWSINNPGHQTRSYQVQETIRREINPIVYPPKEFRSKLAADHHFLQTTLNSPKFFLIGDEHELARLVE